MRNILSKLTPGHGETATMEAVWNGTVLARSDDTVVVEGNHYFPIESVNPDVLRDSSHRSVCPWKGVASYYDVVVDETVNTNAAWYYPHPSAAARKVADRVAFWKGVVVRPNIERTSP